MEATEFDRVELFVRSLAPCGARESQEALVERLLALRQAGVVADLDLTVWGDTVCLDAASVAVGGGADVAAAIRDFRDWCEHRDVSLDPFYEWSVVESSITGETYERVVPPHRCLAVYDDGLLALYPSTVDGEPRSVEDGLAAIERASSGNRRSVAVREHSD